MITFCNDCRFYLRAARECHFNPPTVGATRFPAVAPSDWCGRAEPNLPGPTPTKSTWEAGKSEENPNDNPYTQSR